MTQRRLLLFILFTCVFWKPLLISQNKPITKLSGKVIDAGTGEEIVGANIVIEGTTRGCASDLEGKYSITLVPGTYSIFVSALSYGRKRITELDLEEGKELVLYISLESETIKTQEVVVEAKANTSYEAVLLTKQKNAAAISDGLSAEQIKRTVDATTGDAIRRLVGVTLIDNKFVFVRGTTERYNQTTLNGSSVPSTDPDKKSFSFDMLPSNLLDNTVIIKSATPDLRGDFSGGLIQISTLDFPPDLLLKISAGTSSNTATTGKTFFNQQGGRMDWLGMDDGTRIHTVPSSESNNLLPFFQSLPNTWGSLRQTAPLSSSFSLACGNSIPLGNEEGKQTSELGFITAFSYRSSFQHTDFYQDDWMSNRINEGLKDQFSVLWGAMANISYSFQGLHRISFKNNYNNSAEQEVVIDSTIDNQNVRNSFISLSTWTQRSIYTGQFSGEHQFPDLFGIKVDWHAAFSSGIQQIPDKHQVNYSHTLDASGDPFVLDLGRRSWTSLHDRNRSYSVDIAVPFSTTKVKTGFLAEIKNTDYDVRSFELSMDWAHSSSQANYISQLPLNSIFAVEHLGSGMILPKSVSKPSDTYWGHSTLSAGYLMADIPFSIVDQSFRWIGGVRIENYSVDLTVPLTTTHTESSISHQVEYLPSMNLTYRVTENANLRFAFSKTINRPEFRELAPSDIYDWIKLVYEYGNPDLKQATILNYDVRFELFPSSNELFAVGYFRKIITDAIEQVAYFEPSRILSWRNATSPAVCSGVELELRKHCGFIVPYLANLSMTGNYSRIYSTVEFHDQTTNFSRPLQGQSPYVINVTIAFQEPTLGTSVNLQYNTFGERMIAVGSKYGNRYINMYEEPRDLIDLSINQIFLWGIELKMTVKNLSAKDRILVIDKENAGVIDKALYERVQLSPTFGIQISKSL